MAVVGWWASGRPLMLGSGERFGSASSMSRELTVTTEHRTRHLYCVGSSGSGKSRFARHLLYQDLHANRGLTLVDPQDLQRELLGYIAVLAFGHGRLSQQLIDDLGDKLVIIEPADQRFGAPGINLLELGPGQTAYQLVDSIIEVIKEIWPDCFGPRLEDICRHSLLLLQELGLTVVEMLPLLSDTVFRQTLVRRSRNPDIRLYFEEHLGGLRPAELKTWVESSRNKWSSFITNPYVRPILGQRRSTINFREILDQGKWLIVNVSRDKLKESRRMLGALIVALMHNAAIARDNTPPEQRYFHAIYCDEFQEFYSPAFLHVLEGGRKYGLGLALFHQNLTQPPFNRDSAVIDTILANTHMHVVFNVSRTDAERLGGEIFFPSSAEIKTQQSWLGIPIERPTFWSLGDEREQYAAELMRQRPAEAYVRFRGMGDDDPYAIRVPTVPDVTPDPVKVDALRQHCAAKFYRPVGTVEREIRDRWAAIRGVAEPIRVGRRDFTQ